MKRFGFFALFCGCLLLVGCSSAPVSFDRTPTPDVMLATIAALQAENAQLATQVAGLPATIENRPTATPLPSVTPTATSTPTATPTATFTRVVARRPAATITPVRPQILSFAVDPRSADSGQSVTLQWTTLNATRAVVQQYGALDGSYAEISVAPSGSVVQWIPDRERLYHTFTLVAYNAAGDSTSSSFDVSIHCPYTYFYALPQDDYQWNCPAGPALTSGAAEQYFENGRMIWVESEKRIYVLLNDSGLYTYADTWIAGQPDGDPSLTPPPGRYKPVRGFGKVWSADPYIRSRLGWAMAQEQGYQAQLQRSWLCCGSPSNALYLREFDNRVAHLWPGQTPPGYWEFTLF